MEKLNTAIDLWELVKLFAGAAAVYAAIRSDLAKLGTKVESHAERIKRIEDVHDRRATDHRTSD